MMHAAAGEPAVGPPPLAAGVAEIELQELVSGYWERAGSNPLRPSQPPWPQRLGCLVLEQGEQMLVVFNADWGRWLKLVEETKALVAEAVPHRKATVLCLPTNANHNIDFEGFYRGALDVRSRRHDPGFRAQLLAALHEVFTAARRQVRPYWSPPDGAPASRSASTATGETPVPVMSIPPSPCCASPTRKGTRSRC